jgi:CRP/FNR family transcriptional regulator, nitrogen fixation regulation protein
MIATVQTINRQSRSAILHGAGGMMLPPANSHVPEPLDPQAIIMRADRDEEIVAQGDPAGHCYLVASGCVRTVKLMEDGRRQIGEFLFPGDLFGWEALDEHDFAAEAVTPVMLHRYPRRNLEARADRDPDFARRLRGIAAGQLRAGREHLVLLGRKTASERIASFLLEMAGRMNPNGRASIELPMGRADIADYLGLTIETVCRGLTQLRRRGTITVERANIKICDRSALGAAGSEVVH